MRRNLQLKLSMAFLFVALFSSFIIFLHDSKNLHEIKSNPEFTNQISRVSSEVMVSLKPAPKGSGIGTIKFSPTPSIKQQGKIKGESSPVKFEKDFETSLKIQNLPEIWLEFTDENNQIITVNIPKKAEGILKNRWDNTLKYAFANQSAKDIDSRREIYRDYINDAVVSALKLSKMKIDTTLEVRNLSEEESFAVMRTVARLAIERYKELQNMASQTNQQKVVE